MYKQPYKELFHVFTNKFDEWVNTKKEALTLAKKLYKEHGCVRIYHETEWNENIGVFEDGNCIFSKGAYPY